MRARTASSAASTSHSGCALALLAQPRLPMTPPAGRFAMMKAAADGGIGAAQLTLARWLDAGENTPADAQLALTWSVCARATFRLHYACVRCAWAVSSVQVLVRGCARVRASAVARLRA
jgi:hypothetical protein